MDNICEKNIIHFANGFIPNQLPYNLFANIFNEKILKKALERINKNIAKNSEALVKVADVHSDAKSYNEHGGAECISFSAYKKDGNTRNMGVINPKLYIAFVWNLLVIKDQWLKEMYYDVNTLDIINHSNSPILLFDNNTSWINNIDDIYGETVFNINSNNSFKKNTRNSKKTEGIYTKYLETDFESFYDNIYTHILGNLKDYTPYSELKEKYNDVDNFFDFLDVFNRNVNRNQTKGIVQGPISSNISAELLSIAIDFSLYKECKDCKEFSSINYIRYVDDHTFFSNDIGKLEWVKKKFNKVIKKFKLSLKSEKTIIKTGFKNYKEANINLISLNSPFLDSKEKVSSSDLINQFMKYACELENEKNFSQIKALITKTSNKINKFGILFDKEVVDIFIPYLLKLSFIDPVLSANCYNLIETIIKKTNVKSFHTNSANSNYKREIIDNLIDCLDYVNKEFYETNIQIWHYYLIGNYAYKDQRSKVLKKLLRKCKQEHFSCDSLLILPFIKENFEDNTRIFRHMKDIYKGELNTNKKGNGIFEEISESRWWPIVLSLYKYTKKYTQKYSKNKIKLEKVKPMHTQLKRLFVSKKGKCKIKEFGLFC